jgi:Rhodopirellula transposase DDE domain
MNHDTSAFAVQTIRRWWHDVGCKRYPGAKRLTITCDGGGSNGARVRLWKLELQTLANELGINHDPPPAAWNPQVEQDRAPAIFVHHHELARQTACQLPGHYRSN